jgi:anti-sigma regulatory factor (Ser/Thr protein kinase)
MSAATAMPYAHIHLTVRKAATAQDVRASVRDALAYLERAVAPRQELQPGALVDLLLAGGELVSNALRYVGDCSVRVRLMEPPGRLRLEVADTGPQLPKTNVAQTGGLWLVHAIADDWGVEKSVGATGKVVFVEIGPRTDPQSEEELDRRLALLVRRHPSRASEGHITEQTRLSAAVSRAERLASAGAS